MSDAEGGSATGRSNVVLGTRSLSQFNPNLGVLTGATLNLDSTRTQAAQVQSTAGGGTGANVDVTSNGTGSSSAQLSAAGVSAGFSPLSASDSCTGKWKGDCTGTATASLPGKIGRASCRERV